MTKKFLRLSAAMSTTTNLDALSTALGQISYLLTMLKKKNLKSTISEIADLVSQFGFEAERHFYRNLLEFIDFKSLEADGSPIERTDIIYLNYWNHALSSLIFKPNFPTLICYCFDSIVSNNLLKLPVSDHENFMPSLCKLFKLNLVQQLIFCLALENSIHHELRRTSREHFNKNLPELIHLSIASNGFAVNHLKGLPIESLHSLLIALQQYISQLSQPYKIEQMDLEAFLDILRREYPRAELMKNNAVMLLPLLYPIDLTETDLSRIQLALHVNHSSIEGKAKDCLISIIREIGYQFTASLDKCKSILNDLGLNELDTLIVAQILALMIRTHSSLNQSSSFYNSNGIDVVNNDEKICPKTWNTEIYIQAINDLFPNLNWRDFVKALDHPGFIVLDRQSLILLRSALDHVTDPESYIDLLYVPWQNIEGQLSWFFQGIWHPEVFCFGDYPKDLVKTDCVQLNYEYEKEKWTWRSLSLIRSLLCIADNNTNATIFEIFRRGIIVASEFIFLGLLQVQDLWTPLKRELLQLLVPTILIKSHDADSLMQYMWTLEYDTKNARNTLILSLVEWYNHGNESEQQQRLVRILDIVQHLNILPIVLKIQPIIFILDLACLAARRGYLNLEKWLKDQLSSFQEACLQNILDYMRKKESKVIIAMTETTNDVNAKNILNSEILSVLFHTLQHSLSWVTSVHLRREIQSLLLTVKGLNTSTARRNSLGDTMISQQNTGRPVELSLSTHPQQLYQRSVSATLPLNDHSSGTLTYQARSLQGSSGSDLSIYLSKIPNVPSSNLIMDDFMVVDTYFKRLYSLDSSQPPMSVDEFLDIATCWKNSPHQREKEIFEKTIRLLLQQSEHLYRYPERALFLTAQLLGGFIERNLVQDSMLLDTFQTIIEPLKMQTSSNLWNFSIAALDRSKARVREQPALIQILQSLPRYSEIPMSLREYFEYNPNLNPNMEVSFNFSRSISTPTPNMSSAVSMIAPQPQMPHASMINNLASRVTNVSSSFMNTQTQYLRSSSGAAGLGRDNQGSKVPSLSQNPNILTLMNDPSYRQACVDPPPENVSDKVAFTFNNLSSSNLSQKADELKEVIGNEPNFWRWLAQYLVVKRVSIEPNFHSLYAGLLSSLNVKILYDHVVSETHRNIKILLISDKQINNIPDRSLLRNLGHWLGLITLAKNKPILALDLDIKSLIIEAFHTGSQELLYVIPFVAKVLESCTKSKVFQQPNPWLMGIMSVLAEMHAIPDFRLNLKFEIEVLCRNLHIQLSDLPIHNILMDKDYFGRLEKQLTDKNRQYLSSTTTPCLPTTSLSATLLTNQSLTIQNQLCEKNANLNNLNSTVPIPTQQDTNASMNSSSSASLVPPTPKYKLSDFKSSIPQSLSSMLIINPNILLFQKHPRLITYIHTPIEQAINESTQIAQRSLKVAISAAEIIIRKDFHLNPDEQQLRTSARNMVAYLSSGHVLISARLTLQELMQTYIQSHFQTVLGVSQTSSNGSPGSSTNENDSSLNSSTNSNGTAYDTSSNQIREMIKQAAMEIAATNIELCCCLLQRITIHRAIQLIDQRLAEDIELRQRCRLENLPLPSINSVSESQSERLPESIRLRYGPLSSHQLAIYEDFVHFIPGFKPSDSEKRESLTLEETGPSVWDRLTVEIDQTIQLQRNPDHVTALQRLAESVNQLHLISVNHSTGNDPQTALTTVFNVILYNLLKYYTFHALETDKDNLERFKNAHISVFKLLVEIRLQISIICKQMTKLWLECPNELKFNVHAVNALIRSRLLDIRQVDAHVSHLLDLGNNMALEFAVHFLRTCVIEQSCCSDDEIVGILESLHRISLVGKQPADAVRDLIEVIRLNHSTLYSNPYGTESNVTNNVKIDKLAMLSLSVINNGNKYLLSRDDTDTSSVPSKEKKILQDWLTSTISRTGRISQQEAFQNAFNQMNSQGLFHSDDTIAKFFRVTIHSCVSSVYSILGRAPPISSSSLSSIQQECLSLCHQYLESMCCLLSLITTHTSDINNFGPRIHLINRILGILAAYCYADHEKQGDQFHPLAYQRIILNLFQESMASLSSNSLNSSATDGPVVNEQKSYYIYLSFTNCLHLLRPQRVPAFAFAWLEIIAHRTFFHRLLTPGGRFSRQTYQMYALLLVSALRLVSPYIRAGECPPSFQAYFKGIVKTFMVLLHDFPEFLCEHYYQLCDALPLMAHQLRNIILSACPKYMRCPDPLMTNFKIEMLNDISTVPPISYPFAQNIQPPKFKANLDSYLRTRAPVTFLSELRSYLQQGADPGSHYNIRMLNALVLYVATQALSTLTNRTNGQPFMSLITHSAHMDIFQNLAVDLDNEGRYIFLNSMANHLRYPNAHTHYFMNTIFYLSAEANSEALQEQIVRVLLERLGAHQPQPWGLLVTCLELVRKPPSKLRSGEFMNISPDVKRFLATLTRGFSNFSNSSINAQQQQQQTATIKP